MAKKLFRGYSTVGSDKTRERTFYDIELIKRDLMNHFNTRVGERVMRPTWGCRIWDYLMDPLTPGLRDLIVSEALAVCHADARVQVDSKNVRVFERDHGLRIEIDLIYVPYDVVETFAIDFEKRETARFNGNTR